ncbi:MAG: TonB-dependent receptor domain-containing protein [Longimicrobiales bacterium]
MPQGALGARRKDGSKSRPARSGFLLVRGLFAIFLTGVLAGSASAQAQQQTGQITGTVTDSLSGAPIVGVQVYLEGSQLGAMSRQNGRFAITNVPPGTYRFVAFRIGMSMVTRDITVGAGATVNLDVALHEQALGLDEIVVTGTAGAARRREIGNSIAQINVTTLPEKPVDVTDMLQSVAPGIEVTQGGGGAGQGAKIRLRGSNSINMAGDPIIYIDGVRMMSGGFPNQPAKDQGNRSANVTQSPLDLINPNDIERIEVIKGSAATTLYGTEASAGVIQVFTKRGAMGAPVWTLETQQGTQWSQRFGAGSAKYMYMDPWICTGFLECGEFTHTAHTQMYSGSVRGGGTNLQYFTSGELFDEKGNTPLDGLERWTARGNFTYTPTSTLQLQWNTAYVNHSQTNTPQGNNAEGLELNVFRQDKNYFTSADTAQINQVLNWTLNSDIERFTSGGTATFTPLENLTNRFTIGYDFSNQETRNIRPFGHFRHPEGIIHVSNYERRILTFDYVGSLGFPLMENLRSTFSWGGQAIGDETRKVEGYGRGFPGAAEPTVNSAADAQGYEERLKVWNAGFFLQNIFDLNDRYFLTLGMRVDGNSAFGEGFGLQMYPKISGSWVVSDENFWNPSWGTVKLRSAYGKSGRAPGAFDAVRTWTNTALAGEAAFTPENVGNADLGPEVTGEFEAGFDAAWLDDRVRSTFTYYRQLTDDALLNIAQVPSLGFTQSQLTNVGKIENKGVELTVDVTPIRRESFSWDLGVNVSTNYSKVLTHIDPEDVGRPVTYSLFEVVRNPDAIPSTDGQVDECEEDTPAGEPCILDDQFLGPNLPTRTISGYTSFRLPLGITLSARGEYRGGHFTDDVNPIAIARSVRSPVCFPFYANDDDVELKPGTSALWVARCTPSLNTGYTMKADYFKLRSVSATIPVDFAFPDRVQNATLTLTLGNLYTWSRESLFGTYGFENFANNGLGGDPIGISGNERIPAPTTFRAALRVTF